MFACIYVFVDFGFFTSGMFFQSCHQATICLSNVGSVTSRTTKFINYRVAWKELHAAEEGVSTGRVVDGYELGALF